MALAGGSAAAAPLAAAAAAGPMAILWDIENCGVPGKHERWELSRHRLASPLEVPLIVRKAMLAADGRGWLVCRWSPAGQVPPEDVAGNIRGALRGHPAVRGAAVTAFAAYGDFNMFPKKLREGCQHTGVSLIDVPNGKKDAADKAILVDMFLFALDNPPPSTILLISGDGDFSPALHKLAQRGYAVLLAVPAGVGVSPALVRHDSTSRSRHSLMQETHMLNRRTNYPRALAGSYVWDWPCLARGDGLVPAKCAIPYRLRTTSTCGPLHGTPPPHQPPPHLSQRSEGGHPVCVNGQVGQERLCVYASAHSNLVAADYSLESDQNERGQPPNDGHSSVHGTGHRWSPAAVEGGAFQDVSPKSLAAYLAGAPLTGLAGPHDIAHSASTGASVATSAPGAVCDDGRGGGHEAVPASCVRYSQQSVQRSFQAWEMHPKYHPLTSTGAGGATAATPPAAGGIGLEGDPTDRQGSVGSAFVQPGDLQGLKRQLVELLRLHGGRLALVRVPTEYRRHYQRPLYLTEYGVPKLKYLLERMRDVLDVQGIGVRKLLVLRNPAARQQLLKLQKHGVANDGDQRVVKERADAEAQTSGTEEEREVAAPENADEVDVKLGRISDSSQVVIVNTTLQDTTSDPEETEESEVEDPDAFAATEASLTATSEQKLLQAGGGLEEAASLSYGAEEAKGSASLKLGELQSGREGESEMPPTCAPVQHSHSPSIPLELPAAKLVDEGDTAEDDGSVIKREQLEQAQEGGMAADSRGVMPSGRELDAFAWDLIELLVSFGGLLPMHALEDLYLQRYSRPVSLVSLGARDLVSLFHMYSHVVRLETVDGFQCPSTDLSMRSPRAAMLAAATGGASVLEKRYGRAFCRSNSTTSAFPVVYPPVAPPSACTQLARPAHRSRILASGATWPSMEKTPSVAICKSNMTRKQLQLCTLKIGHVEVLIPQPLCLAEADAVNDRCVIELVADHCILGSKERLKEAAICVEAAAWMMSRQPIREPLAFSPTRASAEQLEFVDEHQLSPTWARSEDSPLLTAVAGPSAGQLRVRVRHAHLRAADEAHGGEAEAAGIERFAGGGHQPRVVAQPEIVVGAQIEHLAITASRGEHGAGKRPHEAGLRGPAPLPPHSSLAMS
eukprot:SM000017S02777  [mRNA]  locus=s17:234707:240157:+ [translate_table: standard]